jgi:hypothetical protein
LSSPWPLLLTIWSVAILWLLIFGTPFESLEMAWFGQLLRWRNERGMAPPVDPNIVHIDIVRSDLAKLSTLQFEYQSAANIILEASDLGAKVIGFDLVFERGNEPMAKPILDEIDRVAKLNRTVVLAEALIPTATNGRVERIRSFPFRERHPAAGLINVKPDADGTFRRYTYAYPSSAGGYEPSFALACYLAWRDVDWNKEVRSPRPGMLHWSELAGDFMRVKPLFGYGVALHSGAALLGNKGSAQRLDYGIVGDLINAAARVESLTKHYGVLLLITRETYARLSSPPVARVIDKVIVLGKSVPLELLELRHAFSHPNFEEIATQYSAAFGQYSRGSFVEAEKNFTALAVRESDHPSRLMAERCRELSSRPPKEWRGVYELKTKS